MVLDYLVSITKVFGTDMEDIKAFEDWMFSNFRLEEYPTEKIKELMEQAWLAAIQYEQNKPMRTYRWDGIIK